MATRDISILPVRLAIDIVLRDVTYSNCMPDWFRPRSLDYTSRVRAVEAKILKYLEGSAPNKPYEILLPRSSGVRQRWVVPSVNDQVIIQACASSLAPRIDKAFDRKRVFSYRYNSDPDTVELTEDQCEAWDNFQRETEKKAKSGGHLLFVDLQQAFGSVNREDFLRFSRQFSSTGLEIDILDVMLKSLSPSGLPLMNDSMFFLGNAYFGVVDKILLKHNSDFVRFIDDYYIFGKSQSDLESLYKSVNKELQTSGFPVNEQKLKLATGEQYCDALSEARKALDSSNLSQEETDAYGPIPKPIPAPGVVFSSVARTVKQPDTYLNSGTGLAQLASLRKMRDALTQDSRRKYAEALTNAPDVLRATVELLGRYMRNPADTWRSVWLLYLLKDVQGQSIRDKTVKQRVDETINALESAQAVPAVVRLWAKQRMAINPDSFVEELSDLDYEAAGKRCYGG